MDLRDTVQRIALEWATHGSAWNLDSSPTSLALAVRVDSRRAPPPKTLRRCRSRCSSVFPVRDPPDSAFLRIRDVESSVRSNSRTDRSIFRSSRRLAGCIEGREPIGENRRWARCTVTVERCEHHAVAALIARAVQNDKSPAAVPHGERFGGIKQEIDRRPAPGLKSKDRLRIGALWRSLLTITAVLGRDQAHSANAIVISIRPTEIGAFCDAMHFIGNIVFVLVADDLRKAGMQAVAAMYDGVEMAVVRRPIEGGSIANSGGQLFTVVRESLTCFCGIEAPHASSFSEVRAGPQPDRRSTFRRIRIVAHIGGRIQS